MALRRADRPFALCAGLAAENLVYEDGVVECTGVARWFDYACVRAQSVV